MVWFHNTMKSAAALAALSFPDQALAGVIGPTSRATVGISLSIAPRIEVRGIRDAGATDPKSPVGSQAVCISANTATRAYGIAVLGTPAPGQARFAFEWAQESGQSRLIPAGTAVMGFVAPEGPCTDQSAANARLVIRSTPQTPVAAANSAATATLLIIPE
jgi:hypothetical protein